MPRAYYEPLTEVAWHSKYIVASLYGLAGVVFLAATMIEVTDPVVASLTCAGSMYSAGCSVNYQAAYGAILPGLLALFLLVGSYWKISELRNTPILTPPVAQPPAASVVPNPAPPAAPGRPNVFCPTCGRPRGSLDERLCSGCGKPFPNP